MVLSSENSKSRKQTRFCVRECNSYDTVKRQGVKLPAESETHSMYRSSIHGNRETREAPLVRARTEGKCK